MVITRSFNVENRLGIHARVAAQMVQTANRFKSKILLEANGQQVNARSILGILTMACPQGSHISIFVDGSDAKEAIDAFAQLFANKFGEE
jgi:phosphocarrier protein HPr